LVRLTVDTRDDLALVRAIYGELYPLNPHFTLADVLQLLDANPEMADMNQHVAQKLVRQ
jgi:spore coat polysaccharide biosynthesis protein SpsF